MKEKFDAVQTFVKAITADNYDSAALFGKLEKWVTEQDSRKLMDTWRDVENYILIEEIPSALWDVKNIKLLCSSSKVYIFWRKNPLSYKIINSLEKN